MRRILIDAARSRKRDKRGGNLARHSLSGIRLANPELDADLLELHDALTELESAAPENAEIVQLKFFSGLTLPECSELLGVSLSTVERRWRFARAWLKARLETRE